MPMEGEERFWNNQNRDGVPWDFQGDQKCFITGVYGDPQPNVLKNLEGTNVKIYKNA